MLSPLADPTAPRSIALDPTKWLDIVAIALRAVVSGDDIEDFGKVKCDLGSFLFEQIPPFALAGWGAGSDNRPMRGPALGPLLS